LKKEKKSFKKHVIKKKINNINFSVFDKENLITFKIEFLNFFKLTSTKSTKSKTTSKKTKNLKKNIKIKTFSTKIINKKHAIY